MSGRHGADDRTASPASATATAPPSAYTYAAHRSNCITHQTADGDGT